MADVLSHRRHELLEMTLSVGLRSQILRALPLDAWYEEVNMEEDSRRELEGRYARYYLETDDNLRHLGHIYVPSTEGFRTLILTKGHCTSYLAHLGVKKMHADLRQLYHWSGMRHDIADFVSHCLECHRVKVEHQHPTDLLQSNLVSD